ncbi:hypothetical protein B0H13DRAFT_2350988 [Mycena leptocephala]|nr:hypothetical protein B0H13DRAFT_2350988 [Mycena leptocephala]
MRNWLAGKLDVCHLVTAKFFLNRESHPVSRLVRVRYPIALNHCSEDVAYPMHYTEELLDLLHQAHLNAQMHTIEGAPHFGNFTHARETNTLLCSLVVTKSRVIIPPAQTSVKYLFLADLLEFGLDENDESDNDFEQFIWMGEDDKD